MKEVYRSIYQTFILFTNESLLVEIWNPISDDMTDELYKQEYLKVRETLQPFIGQYDKLLIDAREFQYPVSPELQQWHNTNILYALGNEQTIQIAIIKSNSPLVQYALEQTLEENKLAKNNLEESEHIKLFEFGSDASQWLTGKQLDCRITSFQAISYQQRNETLTQVWHINSENIEASTFLDEFQNLAKMAKAYRPFKLLLNAQDLNFPGSTTFGGIPS